MQLAQPPLSPEDFRKDVVPVLLDRWLAKCFCKNPGFLKLLAFDFADYKRADRMIAPVELIDSEMLWSTIVAAKFEPQGDWLRDGGGSRRIYRCPQCGLTLATRSEQYSINMWPTTTRPKDDRALAAIGLYLVGYHGFGGKFDPAWILDFRPALSIDQFVDSVTSAI